MANQELFQSTPGRLVPATDTLNREGAPAYRLPPKQRLAQLLATGCFNQTFYADGADQVRAILEVANELDAEYLVKAALWARQYGYMKDSPALIAAILAVKDGALLERVFARVIDTPKMLRNFVQILRSGVVGRKSLGTRPKRLVERWLEQASDAQLLNASVGQAPSLADLVKMVHPKPANPAREAFYAWLIGRPHDAQVLPPVVADYERFKREGGVLPAVDWQLLTALPLTAAHWVEIARNAKWHMTRMNLNTFARHGVFAVEGMTELVAARLRDAEVIRKARVFPYQLLAAYANADDAVPVAVKEALQDALEASLANVPALPGQVFVLVDVSGSMRSPVTGTRKGASTKVQCVEAAALIASAVLRANPTARVLPFEQDVVPVTLNPRDSVVSNTAKLAALGGGGTNVSAPLAQLNREGAHGDLVWVVSDNQSWVDAKRYGGPALAGEFEVFRRRNPRAKLVCLDLQPYGSTQAAEREDILNVGGFSDAVFELVAAFAEGRMVAGHWVEAIEAIAVV